MATVVALAIVVSSSLSNYICFADLPLEAATAPTTMRVQIHFSMGSLIVWQVAVAVVAATSAVNDVVVVVNVDVDVDLGTLDERQT